MEKEMVMYGNKVYGVEVSNYGIENGYLDYRALARIVGDMIVGDMILNNTIRSETMEDFEIVAGRFTKMIFQDYIISEQGYKFLEEYTDEIVFYNENLDIYVWGITHFGTSWDYVLTDIKLTTEELY